MSLILGWGHLAGLCNNQIEGSHLLLLAMKLQLETVLQHRLQHLLKLRRLAILELLEAVGRSTSWHGGLEVVKVGCCPIRLAGDETQLENAGFGIGPRDETEGRDAGSGDANRVNHRPPVGASYRRCRTAASRGATATTASPFAGLRRTSNIGPDRNDFESRSCRALILGEA